MGLQYNTRWLSYISVVILILMILFLQIALFSGDNYREDEINTVHGALLKSPSEITQWMATNIHPPGWRLLANAWTDLFGPQERITRLLSTLGTAITLAFLFRSGSDLANKRVGLLAVLLLGATPFYVFYAYEFRPYTFLVASAAGMQFAFLRWLRKPNFQITFLYVILGITALYTHYFALYLFLSQFVFLIVFVQWNKRIYARVIIMWGIIGISFLGWILPFIHGFLVKHPGGIGYALPTNLEGLVQLFDRLQLEPSPMGLFLLLLGLLIPASQLSFAQRNSLNPSFRFGTIWPKGYVVTTAIITLIAAMIANLLVRNVTPRNMIILLPSISVIMAMGISMLQWRARLILIVMIFVLAPSTYQRFEDNGAYQEILTFFSATYQPDSVIIIGVKPAWRWLMPIPYYLLDRLPGSVSKYNMAHLVEENDNPLTPSPPDILVNIIQGFSADDQSKLDMIVGDSSQLWYVQAGEPLGFSDDLQAWLDERYVYVRDESWIDQYPIVYHVTEYRRIPENTQTLFSFGEHITMRSWLLHDSVQVQPCLTITFESWWQTDFPVDTNYSMTLVMIKDSGQGIARSDGSPTDRFTHQWLPMSYYLDERQVQIPCDIEPGEYPLMVGLYNFETLESLPVADVNDNVIGELAYLTTLYVE